MRNVRAMLVTFNGEPRVLTFREPVSVYGAMNAARDIGAEPAPPSADAEANKRPPIIF